MGKREFTGRFTAGVTASAASGVSAAAAIKGGAKKVEQVDRLHRKEWAREHFKGFENILVPSFTPDLKSLDEEGIRLDVRKSIDHGFFSALCSPASLSHEEMKRFIEVSVDEAGDTIAIGFALHAESDEKMFDLLDFAENAGAQHFLLDLPNEGSQDDLYKHAMRIAESTNMAIYPWLARKYNFKRFHPSGVPIELYDRLADVPNIVALKVAEMDPATIFELFERYNDRMLMGVLLLNLMPICIKLYDQQWSGAWSVEAIQSPEKPYATEFFELMLAHKHEQGMKLYWDNLLPAYMAMGQMLRPVLGKGGHPWEHFKLYQFLTGGNGGAVRVDPEQPDLPPVTRQDLEGVRGVYRSIGITPTDAPDEAFYIGRMNYMKGLRPPAR